MKVLVTGATGFIGNNLCARLNTLKDIELATFTKEDPIETLTDLVAQSDFIFHLAGVNRPVDEAEFAIGNTDLTNTIIEALRSCDKNTPLLISSSVQANLDNPYGKSKLAAENLVKEWSNESSSQVIIYRLPGVFGKWCKPNYNSVVATFCHNISHDLPIEVSDPAHQITIAYIDDVINQFTAHLTNSIPAGYDGLHSISNTFTLSLGELQERILQIHSIRTSLVIPNLEDKLNKFLYATYISYVDTNNFSYNLGKNSDDRGWLAEFIKSSQFGQIFISKTKPGITRGDHWHHTKIEKFLVVEGTAEITFRNKINEQDIIVYPVTGDALEVVDIPTGYVHAIKNVGETDLLTLFWANEILDKENPDTYYERVEEEMTKK